MAMIQGLGGVFIYAEDVEKLAAWYSEQLGLELQSWGSSRGLQWPSADVEPSDRPPSTVFAIFKADGPLPVNRTARLNFRTHDLDLLIARLEAGGQKVERSEDESYGRFAWVHDPEGNRLELWEPQREAQ